MKPESPLQALGGRITVQQVLTPFRALFPDFQLSGFDVEGRSGVEFAFGFRVEGGSACVRVGTVALGEVLFPLDAVFISPPDLPPVALAVTSSRVEGCFAPAVLAAWLVTW